MNIIQMLQNAHTASVTLQTTRDMLADAAWLGGGSGTPYVSRKSAGTYSDPTAKSVERLMHLRQKLESTQTNAISMYDAAIAELKRIPDGTIQKILYLRHYKNLKWHDITAIFGTGYTSDMLKQRYSRFCRKLPS